MVNKVLILTELGEGIGFGHFTRCLSLHDCFLSNGLESNFIVYEKNYDIGNDKVISHNWLEDLDYVIEKYNSEVVLVDSYLAKKEDYKKLQSTCENVIAIDDYNRIAYPCNIVINPNVFFSDLDYTNQSAKLFGGKDFVLLRDEFRRVDQDKKSFKGLKTISVSLGGTDYRGLVPTIVKSVSDFDQNISLNIVDPEGRYKDEDFDNKAGLNLYGKLNAQEYIELHGKSDLVISACGQSLHEFSNLGYLSLGIWLDIDQTPNHKFYLNEGYLAFDIKYNDSDIVDKIKEGLKFFAVAENRQSIIEKCDKITYDSGVDNVLQVIQEIS